MTGNATTRTLQDGQGRLDVLDGLRGIAALAVLAYHMTTRWSEPLHMETLYPFGAVFPEAFPALVHFGTFGIQLFFLVSGFVILMTLERSSGLADFALRRMARLWPAMLVCATLSTLIINASGIAGEIESVARFAVTPLEYVSSIFFIDPALVSGVLAGPPAQWVEGVYWTLWAEVRFYGLVALVFLVVPQRAFVWSWAGLQAGSSALALGWLSFAASLPGWPVLELILQPGYLGWFTLGVISYRYWTGRFDVACSVAGLLAAIALIDPGDPVALARDGVVLGVFALFLLRSRLLAPLRWRPLVATGLASYPLYLFHERAGLIALRDLSEAGMNPYLALALVSVLLVLVALSLHRWVERPAKHAITARLRPAVIRAEARLGLLRFEGGGPPGPVVARSPG